MTILPSPIPHPLDFSPWDLPGWAYEALEWVVGFDWPEGNEKTTWDVADQWYELVSAMAAPREDAADAAARFVAAYGGSGTTIDAFVNAWKAVADGDEAPLNALVTFAAEMGKVVDECAQDIEAAKLEAWIELGLFVIELIGLAVTVALTLGAASPAAAGIIAATRMAIQQIFKRLIAQLSRKAIKQALKDAGQRVAKDVLTKKGLTRLGKQALGEAKDEAREEFLTNLSIQAYQAGVGHSDGIDLGDLGRSTLAGAAGGASATVAGIGAGNRSGMFRGAAAEVFGEMGGAAVMGDLPGFDDLAKAGTSGAAGSAISNTRQSFQDMGAGLDTGGLDLNDLPPSSTSTSSSGTDVSSAYTGPSSGNAASSGGSADSGGSSGGSTSGGGSSGGSADSGVSSSGGESSAASVNGGVSSGGSVNGGVSSGGSVNGGGSSGGTSHGGDSSGSGSSTVSSFVSSPADTSVTASAASSSGSTGGSSSGHSGGQSAASAPPATAPSAAPMSSEATAPVSPSPSAHQPDVTRSSAADVTLSSVAPPAEAPAHAGTSTGVPASTGIPASSPAPTPANVAPAANTVTNAAVAFAPATGNTGPAGSPSITPGPTSFSSPNPSVSLTGGGPATATPSVPTTGTPTSGPTVTAPSTTPTGTSTTVTAPQALDTGGARSTGPTTSPATNAPGPSLTSPAATTSPVSATPTATAPAPSPPSSPAPTQPAPNDQRPGQASQPRQDIANNDLPVPGGVHAAPHLTSRTPEQARHEQAYFDQYDRNKQVVIDDLRAKAVAPWDAAILRAQQNQQIARRGALKATLTLNIPLRRYHQRMEAIHQATEVHALAQRASALNAPLADIDLPRSQYYGTANTEYAQLTRSDQPVWSNDRSALTGSGNPLNSRTGRPYNLPGGLREPLRLHQADLELAVPRGQNNLPVRTPDPRGPFLRLINDGGPGADPTRGFNCLDCSLSFFETYVHGRPTVAAPRTVDGYSFGRPDMHGGEAGGPDRAELATGSAFTMVTPWVPGQSPAAVKADVDRGFDKIIDALQRGGHGSTAIIINVWQDSTSHAWNAVNHNGSILFLDPQTGEHADATNFVPGSPGFPTLYGHTGVSNGSNVVELHTLMVDGQGNPMAVENTPHSGFNNGATPVPPPPPPVQQQAAPPQQLPPSPPLNLSPQPPTPAPPAPPAPAPPTPPAPPAPAPPLNSQPPGPPVSTQPQPQPPGPPVSTQPQPPAPPVTSQPAPSPTLPVDSQPVPSPAPPVHAAPQPVADTRPEPGPAVDVVPQQRVPFESQDASQTAPPTVRVVEEHRDENGPSSTATPVDDSGRTTSEEASPRTEPAPYRQVADPLAVLDPVSSNGPADRDPLAALDPSNDPRLAEAPAVGDRAAAERQAREDYHYENDRTRREFDAEYRQRLALELRRQAEGRFEQAERAQDALRNAYGRGDPAETARYEHECNRLLAEAEDLRDRARHVDGGGGLGDVELTGNDWERVNDNWSELAPGPVETGDRSALTGDDRPRSIDTTRRYNHRGGLRPPLRIHQTDLERAMPRDAEGNVIRQADPRDGEWFGLVNDGGPEADPTRSINCGDSVLSLFETYMHGRPRVSAPRTFDGYHNGDPTRPIGAEQGVTDRIETTTGGRFEGLTDVGGLDPDDARVEVRMAEIRLRTHLTGLGHGSFAFVTTQDQAGRTHAFAAVNQNGTILYLDPQTRQVSPSTPIRTHSGLGAPCDVLRMDALVVDGQSNPRPLTAGADSFVAADPAGAPGGSGSGPSASGSADLDLDEVMRRYELLGEIAPRFDLVTNDQRYLDQGAHTIERHGPDVPLERDANHQTSGIRTIEGRIFGDAPWRRTENKSFKWIDHATMKNEINNYLQQNWETIRSDLALKGEHLAEYNAGHLVGHGYHNKGMYGVGDRESEYGYASKVGIRIKLVEGTDPPEFFLITAFPYR
ncbi:toxin glutamine deamidase domain-containing protein [Actinoplanes sp. NPDC023801]|uniref:toxin glutamine deamidase domain-containing protein n=1 Tax=Actinoplanes sp. NPDC023801 TaxID=3154595 RepID=UPI0033E6DCCA